MPKFPTINSFSDAVAYLGNKPERTLHGNETHLVKINDHTVAIKYHWTNVVVYHDDGRITLRTGGYHSFTTKKKMNEYLPMPYAVCQEKFNWFIRNWETKEQWGFEDGISIWPDGMVFTYEPLKITTEEFNKHLVKSTK